MGYSVCALCINKTYVAFQMDKLGLDSQALLENYLTFIFNGKVVDFRAKSVAKMCGGDSLTVTTGRLAFTSKFNSTIKKQ